MRRPKHWLLGVALPFICLAAAESVRADSKVYLKVLHSTGLVEVPHAEGQGPGPDWTLATLLVGAMAVLLFLGIKDSRQRHPTNGTAARTGDVEKGCSPGPSSGQVSNEGKSDAAYHGS
jgi:hypothetical protein